MVVLLLFHDHALCDVGVDADLIGHMKQNGTSKNSTVSTCKVGLSYGKSSLRVGSD